MTREQLLEECWFHASHWGQREDRERWSSVQIMTAKDASFFYALVLIDTRSRADCLWLDEQFRQRLALETAAVGQVQ